MSGESQILVTVAKFLNRSYEATPNFIECSRIEQVLFGNRSHSESPGANITEVAGFLRHLQSGGKKVAGMHGRECLALLEKGLSIVRLSGLSSFQHDGFLDSIGALAATRGSFRGVQTLRRAFEESRSSGEAHALSEIFKSGLSAGEEPRQLARAGVPAAQLAANDPSAMSALITAVTDQSRANGSVVAVLSSFSRMCWSFGKGSLQGLSISRYEELLGALRPHRLPIHLLSANHVREFMTSERGGYPKLLAVHLCAAGLMLQHASAAKGLFDSATLEKLRVVAGSAPNPAMISVFTRALAEDISHRISDSSQASQDLFLLLPSDLDMTVSEWEHLNAIHSIQAVKGHRAKGLFYAVCDILLECEDFRERQEAWSSYVSLVNRIKDDIPTLALVTRGVLQKYREDPTNESIAHLVDLINCTELVFDTAGSVPGYLSSLMSKLLSVDGLGECLITAVSTHLRLGRKKELLSSYRVFRDLPPEGLLLLKQLVSHQTTLGLASDNISENLASLQLFTEQKPVHASLWQHASTLVAKLATFAVPMDFLTVRHVQEYIKAKDEEVFLKKAASNLQSLQVLSALSTNSNEEDKVDKLLDGVSQQGPYSPAVPVLNRLCSPTDSNHESLSCAEIAALSQVPTTISEHCWAAIGRNIDAYRERGGSLQSLCSTLFTLDIELFTADKAFPDSWSSANEILSALADAPSSPGKNGLPADLLSADFVMRFHEAGEEPRALLIHFICGLSGFLQKLCVKSLTEQNPSTREGDRATLRRKLQEVTFQGFGLTDNPAMVHKLKLILAHESVDSLNDFFYVVRELKLHALTDIMRNATDPARQAWASSLMSRTFNMGGPPYTEDTPEAKRHFNDSMQVVDRAFRDSKGFGGVALDCRGLPSSTQLNPVPPMMLRFSLDSAAQTCVVNSSTNDRFPGKGYFISELQTEKLFSIDPAWQQRGKSSPYWRWITEDGLFAGPYFHEFDMDGLAACSFLKVRGVDIVFPPAESRFCVDGDHYSYLVYNRHFAPFPQVALGVPTVVLQELLGSSLIPATDYRGFDSTRTDLSKVDLSPKSLREACKRRGLNLLDLTYGSVIGGGLCNAYAPKSLPHYGWGIHLGTTSAWKDTWGHTHKSWLDGRHPQMGITLNDKLAFAREIQVKIFDAFRAAQDYSAAFRFALSFYKMGSTLITDTDSRINPSQDEQDANEGTDISDGEELPVHEYRYRMLQESYRWHLGAREHGWRYELYPELHFAWVLDPNSLPPKSERRFHLDLATMQLTTKEGTFQLPKNGDGFGQEEREIWRRYVVPHFVNDSTGWEPRFLMRDGAFTIHE